MRGCMHSAPDISGYRKHWAARFGTAPFLPMSRAEMDLLGWDSCDVIIVTGDAYVDHPSFGMIGASTEVVADFTGKGKVRYGGELWNARSDRPLRAGDTARIVKVEGLTLWVEPQ